MTVPPVTIDVDNLEEVLRAFVTAVDKLVSLPAPAPATPPVQPKALRSPSNPAHPELMKKKIQAKGKS